MNVKTLGLALGLCMSGSVLAAVTMTVPEQLIVVSVNGQAIKSGLFKSQKDYKVEPGVVNLTLRYQQYFELPNARHEIVKSALMTLQTPKLIDQQHYRVELLNPPQDVDQANTFAQSPQIAIYDQNNKVISQASALSLGAKPSITAGLFSKTIDLSHTENQANTVDDSVAINTDSSQLNASKQHRMLAPVMTVVANAAVDQQLIMLWRNASKTERQKFMSWLANQ